MTWTNLTRDEKKVNRRLDPQSLTIHRDKEYVYHAISAGAEGYPLKVDADTELFAAVEKIRHGEHYISPLLSGKLSHELIQKYLK